MPRRARATKDTATATPELDLRSRPPEGEVTPEMKRFDIFLIDTGWNVGVSKLVRSHLPLLYEYQRQDSLYILTPEQSVALMKNAPDAIGRDPIVAVYDLYASTHGGGRPGNYHGFRLNLGLIRRPEQALLRLQEFVRFIAVHRAAHCLQCEVQRELHREGLKGMVKILREASTEFL